MSVLYFTVKKRCWVVLSLRVMMRFPRVEELLIMWAYSKEKLIWHWKPCCFSSPPAVQNAYLFICLVSYEIGVLNTTQLHFHHSLLMSAGDYIALIIEFFQFSSQLEQLHLLPWFSKALLEHLPLPSLNMSFASLACPLMHIWLLTKSVIWSTW